MANAIYDKYKEALLSDSSNISVVGGAFKVSLINSDLTAFGSTDEFYLDLNSDSGVVATVTLANVTATSGVIDADNVTFESVANTTPESEALLFWIDTGSAATDRLVAWLDTNIDGFPITPDGSNVDITWSTSGIFKL